MKNDGVTKKMVEVASRIMSGESLDEANLKKLTPAEMDKIARTQLDIMDWGKEKLRDPNFYGMSLKDKLVAKALRRNDREAMFAIWKSNNMVDPSVEMPKQWKAGK